jgi:alkyldihydroxyacetonephosphate synthase
LIKSSDYVQVYNENFHEKIKESEINFSVEFEDRFYHGHDQSCSDIIRSLYGKLDRIPDMIAWPKNHDEVLKIVKLANEFDVAIIPFGGGTNVTGAVKCPMNETRMILSLDMTEMNKLLWIDGQSMLACFECGISGKELEEILGMSGFTMGHEPDSIEFSTLGGWIATKSSGLKQQLYGNIEDMIVKFKLVTSVGVLENFLTPRHSTGPDIERLVIGSEGTLGVVTEAVVKIHKKPENSYYAYILFPNTQMGVQFLKNCIQNSCVPSNIRLFCSESIKILQDLTSTELLSNLKIFSLKMLCKLKGWHEDSFVAVTYIIDGTAKEINDKNRKILKISSKFGGFNVGSFEAEKSHRLSTVALVYLRVS